MNSSVFSLIRLQLLSSISDVGKDGVAYRELKAAFGRFKRQVGTVSKEKQDAIDKLILEMLKIKAYLKNGNSAEHASTA